MRQVKRIVILIFVFSLAVTGFSKFVEFKNQDPTKPLITSEIDELELSVNYEEADLYQGLHASDAKDGDLTDEIIAGNFSAFVEKGVCKVKYVVFDSSNQPAELTRKVRFTDYESPKFTLSQPLVFTTGTHEDLAKYVGAVDCLDGNLSAYIKAGDYYGSTYIDFSTVGAYTYPVEITNDFGDYEMQELPVHIIEPERTNVQVVLKNPILYVNKGDKLSPREYIAEVKDSQGLSISTSHVQYKIDVDMTQAGLGEIRYVATDDHGQKGETWLTVIVRDNQAE